MVPDLSLPPVAVTIVDDDPFARDLLVRVAHSCDYGCQTADTAEHALLLLEQVLTPIVITDLLMPGRGGLWLVREVRRRWPQVGLIVLTAGLDPEATRLSLRAGADHFFFKPVHLDELRHVLRCIWNGYCLRREDQHQRATLEQAVRLQTRRARHTFQAAIDSLALTLEERDPDTARHSRRVHRYALRLADTLGLDRRLRRLLSLAARLHDIGKLALPDALLHKPGPLTPAERDLVHLHPGTGERILAPVVRNGAVLAAIRGHHERLDGSGYPDGLRGDRIPILARLIAVPDCFDALTSARAYHPALPVADALAILRAGAGRFFQPEFVRAFLDVAPGPPVAVPAQLPPAR